MADRIWTPKSKDDLKKLINANIALSNIDTSLISDMSEVFMNSKRTDFSGIERWNTSNVTNMECMFANAIHFNANINAWDTSKVTNMGGMFSGAIAFNQPLDSWNVSNVEEMAFMFAGAESFNQPLNSWDTSSVRDMAFMFAGAVAFNQPLDKWITIFVENMGAVFCGAESFNQNINDWNVSNVKHMGYFIYGIYTSCSATNFYEIKYDFNCDEDSEIYKKYTKYALGVREQSSFICKGMFGDAKSFNQPLDSWNVSNVAGMYSMFRDAESFNQPLDKWNVSNVENMEDMFCGAKAFNQNLDSWSVDSLEYGGYASDFKGSAMENNPPKWCKE